MIYLLYMLDVDYEEAIKARNAINFDIPSALVFDIGVNLSYKNKEALIIANKALEKYPENAFIKAMNIYALLRCFKSKEAIKVASNIFISGSKLERSVLFRAKVIAGCYSDEQIDKEYVKKEDLYVWYCLQEMKLRIGEYYRTIKECMEVAPKGWILELSSWNYCLDCELKKGISIIGSHLSILAIKDNFSLIVEDGMRIENLTIGPFAVFSGLNNS